MAFKFWNPADAATEFGSTLKQWVTDFSLKGLYEEEQTREYIAACRTFGAKSSTAMQLLSYVEGHPKVINIIGMSGGFQAFGSSEGEHKLPAIFLDLDALLKAANTHTFVKEPHNLHFDMSKRLAESRRTGMPMTAPDRKLHMVDPIDFNNKLAVFHEIGHAKQWIERPMFFENQPKVAIKRTRGDDAALDKLMRDLMSTPLRSASKKREAALKLGGSEQDARLQGKTFAQDIRAGAEKLWNAKTFQSPEELVKEPVGLPAKADIETFYATRIGAWSRAIEFDNMSRHEWPICEELGLPFRTCYTDLSLKNGLPQNGLNTDIKRMAEAEQNKKSEVDKGSLVCPHCGASTMNLQLHANKCAKKPGGGPATTLGGPKIVTGPKPVAGPKPLFAPPPIPTGAKPPLPSPPPPPGKR